MSNPTFIKLPLKQIRRHTGDPVSIYMEAQRPICPVAFIGRSYIDKHWYLIFEIQLFGKAYWLLYGNDLRSN